MCRWAGRQSDAIRSVPASTQPWLSWLTLLRHFLQFCSGDNSIEEVYRISAKVEDLLPALLCLFSPLLVFQLSDSIFFFKCIRKFLLTYLVERQSLTFSASSKELLLLSTSFFYFIIFINSNMKNLEILPSWINVFILHILKISLYQL